MGLFTALAFLTAIPVPTRGKAGAESYARSVPYFPLVGLLLGLILVGLDFLLRLAFPPLVVSALLVAATLGLTGALHLDGFIDCCDGLLGSRPPEARLAIMKDSRSGSFGVAGAGVLLLLRFAALASLPVEIRPPALLLAPLLSRWGMAYAVAAFPYGRPEVGVGKMFKDYLGWKEVIIATAITLLAAGAIGQLGGLAAFVVVVVVVWLVAKFALGRIPGLTGDVYGAINELSEVAVLLLMPAIVALLVPSV